MRDPVVAPSGGHGGLPLPESLDEIRAVTSGKRWRVFEVVEEVLAEIEAKVDWEGIYDGDAELAEYVTCGLFVEEAIPVATRRIREIVDEPDLHGAPSEATPEELEDHLFWGSKQIENGMQQTLTVLSRRLVSSLTEEEEAGRKLPAERGKARRSELCMVIAEAVGKLRSDLRRFAAFVVASKAFDANAVEVVLFPRKNQELADSQRLKDRLVETMESFQGSERRMPIAEVIRQWRCGEVWGSSALAEIDMLIRSLASMLERDYRKALYVDSYYRLSDWISHLRGCSEGLRERLGNELVEDTLTKEVAAVLDSDMLAEILGHEMLFGVDRRDLLALLRSINEREITKLEISRAEQNELLELRAAAVEDVPLPELDDRKEMLVRSAVEVIKGRRLVDQLRIRAPLPETYAHLEHVHPLVVDSEEGLKTYLMLLYGQIQNRDLQLLEVDQREVSTAEKRLAVLELEYQLSRLGSMRRYQAFEAVRCRIAALEAIEVEEWTGLDGFLEFLTREIAPRLERISTYAEVEGIPADSAARLRQACQEIQALDEAAEFAELEGHLETLVDVLGSLKSIRVVLAPPQTEAEIEDFLNMMG